MPTSDVLDAYIALRREVALIRASESNLTEFGHNQISLLYRLGKSSATMGELAEHALSDKASTSRTVSLLEKAGLVRRKSDPDDKRLVLIELTAKGRTKALKAQAIKNSIAQKLDSNLTSSERKEFVALVAKIINSSVAY